METGWGWRWVGEMGFWEGDGLGEGYRFGVGDGLGEIDGFGDGVGFGEGDGLGAAAHWRLGDEMMANITFLLFFAVFDVSVNTSSR